ncbi:MAG: flagellar protein FlbB [Alphaproteobacteria bacterium]|nr:flagellar protein FlbB [Alphaproteobacteria bacterium]
MSMLFVVLAVAFLARVAELVTGVQAVGIHAYAESKPREASAKSEENKPAEKMPEKKTEEGKADKQAEKPENQKKPESGSVSDSKKPEKKAETKTDPWQSPGDGNIEDSPVRNELIEDLAARRKVLEKKESDLVMREALLKAAEKELKHKYEELASLRKQIEELLNTQSEEESKRIGSLVKIYEGMKPADAARIFDTLDLDILSTVMGKMSERKLSPILAAMSPERARTITVMLAQQKQLPQLPQ